MGAKQGIARWLSVGLLMTAAGLTACGQQQDSADDVEFDPSQEDQQLQPGEARTGQLDRERPEVQRSTGGEMPPETGTAMTESSAMNEATSAFAAIDNDASGDLTEDEWDTANETITERAFADFDANGDGQVDRNEFLEVAAQQSSGESDRGGIR